jgi:hypothetical protein
VVTIPNKPDPRNFKYLQLVQLQLDGKNKAEIATYFGCPSAEEVFAELKGHGFPVCEVCGANPVVSEHCRQPAPPRAAAGETLAAPATAASLFREALATLSAEITQLEHWHMIYDEAGRFDTTFEAGGTYVVPLAAREFMTEAQLEALGALDDSPAVKEAHLKAFKGVTHMPIGPVVPLIAAYVLTGHPIEPLVEALRQHPEAANLEQIEALVRGSDRSLEHVAQNVARAILHSKAPRGRRHKPDLSPGEQRRQQEDSAAGGDE